MEYINNKDFLRTRTRPSKFTAYIHKGQAHLEKGLTSKILASLNMHENISIMQIKTPDEKPALLKVNKLKDRSKIIRATFGISRRGTYDGPIAEIANIIDLQHINYIPNIIAYGFIKNRLGLIRKTFLLTDFIENSLTVDDFIKQKPELTWDCIGLSLAQIVKCYDDNFIHLDLWFKNILVNPSLTKSWVIDLEYCKIGSFSSKEAQIGHSLGYFFWYGLSEKINLDDYLAFTKNWLITNKIEVDIKKLMAQVTYAATHEIKRKKKLELF